MPTFEVVDKPEVARLVRFSTGKLNPDVVDHLHFKCFNANDNSEKRPKKRKTVVTTEVSGMKFSGQNFGTSNHFSTELCDYYVAVHRKGADKVQILPAEIFQLQPQFEDINTEKMDAAGDSDRLFSQKKLNLLKTFGSGRIQAKVNRQEKSLMTKDMMEDTTKGIADKVIASDSFDSLTVHQEVESSLVPPHNKDATQVRDVYPLDSIIPPDILESLQEMSAVFDTCKPEDIRLWKENKYYPEAVLYLLERLPPGLPDVTEHKAALMYLHCMVHAHNMKANDFKKTRNKYPDTFPIPVRKLLDANFTVATVIDRSGRKIFSRPKSKRDYLMSHILVLYMRLSGYEMALDPLVVDLKKPMVTLSTHSQLLGFRVRKGGMKDEVIIPSTARLELPLVFPTPRKIKGKN